MLLMDLYSVLAWEPSAAKVTKSYSRHLPALEQFYPESKFSAIKAEPLNLEFQNKAKNIPVGLPNSPIKICGESVKGFLSYDRTNKQRLQLYKYRYSDC